MSTRVCVFGAGAIGTYLATRLLAGLQAAGDAGFEVSVVARGPARDAIAQQGLLVRTEPPGSQWQGRPHRVTDDPTTLPPQDIVFITLKAPAVPAVAQTIAQMLAPGGVAVFVLNGIPWWWRHGLPGPAGPMPLLDPEGRLWHLLRERTLGCITWAGAEVTQPGVAVRRVPGGWRLGEPDGSHSARLQAVAELMHRSGLEDVQATADLRRAVWHKLVVNASRNPLAALTRLPSRFLSLDAGLHAMMKTVMTEVLAVARATGWDVADLVDLDELAAVGQRPPTQRPSMLQDVLGGRALEHEALLGQMCAFADEHGVDVPVCRTLLTLLRGLDQSARL